MLNSRGQVIPIAAQDTEEETGGTGKDFKIIVTVEEVRLDAVVLDKKGHQITDLTAEDFEIYQDGQKQRITSAIYMNDYEAKPAENTAPSKHSSETIAIPSPMLRSDQVRRTIAFVVDDLSGYVSFSRLALERFVKNEMQQGDLVAIIRMSRGTGALQLFSSDKRQLLGAAKSLTNSWPGKADLSQVMAISYCIKALQDMPGRKYLVLLTPHVTLPDYRMAGIFNRLADAALRAGVVIHTLDLKGLEFDPSPTRAMEWQIPLSEKTGGLFVENSNYFVTKSGIGSVNEDMKGYYLLSYIPPPGTFQRDRGWFYHRIKIKVKQRKGEVHTRDGFYGAPGALMTATGNRNSLRDAIFSPFQHNDLKVRLAFGYIDNSPKGYLLRSWLNVDAGNLNIVEDKGGGGVIALDIACVTSDVNDYMEGAGTLRYEFRVPKENIAWVRKYGLRFSVTFPVKTAGAYYVRAAVKDANSGKIGSAYNFMEIPDLKKNRLALSSIFFIDREEDEAWIESGTTSNPQSDIQPDLKRDPRRNPASRSYLPGESFEYMAVVYNAKSKDGANPDLESQCVIYRDGGEVFKSEPETVVLRDAEHLKRILIKKKWFLNTAASPGDYALQLLVTDKRAKGKNRIATQAVDFEIVSRQIPNSAAD
jgi:VWFA-related protein